MFSGMAGKKREEVREKDVGGLKYFDKLMPLLERLHNVGCECDTAGNRRLHMDEYCMLVLLFLFNPIVSSLRAIQQACELKKVQRKLKCPRASLGSLSEAAGVFEPERLKEIIRELGEQLKPVGRDARLKDVKHVLTLVDGTLLRALPKIAGASLLDARVGKAKAKWRLHAHFEVERHVPTRMDLTEGSGRGASDERVVLEKTVEPDRCYVMDRGYAKFALFNKIVAAGSSYVCRIRDNSVYEILEERPISDEARQQGIVLDAVVKLGGDRKVDDRPDHPVRLVLVKTKPHEKRGKYHGGSTGPASNGHLRIATNQLDVPADIVGLMFRYRWTVEVFFRFFKHILGCRHLLSEQPAGIEIQTYCAIIACMLISLWTGRKPTLRTYEMICYYFIGWADEEELLAHLAKLKTHDA